MTFSTYIFEIVGDLSWGHLGHIIRYAFEWTGIIPSAMEFLDMEKFTSILCLFVCLLQKTVLISCRPLNSISNRIGPPQRLHYEYIM